MQHVLESMDGLPDNYKTAMETYMKSKGVEVVGQRMLGVGNTNI
jgi:hypothetical protein